ncbi:MAG: T9SS type A sorting domain-containing protein [Ignavibacteria bacterium]|nr:T9SS type A sorting domain-containing protein [Ignavibacteria bacterium]
MVKNLPRVLSTSALILFWFVGGSTAQSLYWIDADFYAPKLGKSDTDGSNAVLLMLDSLTLPQGLDRSLTNGALYWAEMKFDGAAVRRAGADLGQTDSVTGGKSLLRGIAVDSDSGWIYLTSSNLITGPRIERVRTDGSVHDTLIALDSADGNPRAIALDFSERKMYWCEFSSGTIRRAELTPGAVPQDVLSGLEGPVGLALDPSQKWIYWTEANANVIRRSTFGGDSVTTLVAGLATPNYLALDIGGGKMYWGEIGTPRLRRANLDGSDVETLLVPVSHPTGILVTPSGAVDVSRNTDGMAEEFSLSQNYPNPFNPRTTIRFTIPQTSDVRLKLYNMLGQEMITLVDGEKAAGVYDVSVDANAFASGMYLYRIQAGDFVATKKMLLLK